MRHFLQQKKFSEIAHPSLFSPNRKVLLFSVKRVVASDLHVVAPVI
jgi:hypothetical protein